MKSHTATRRLIPRFLAAVLSVTALQAQAATLGGPLTLEDEGSFFVNGQSVMSNYPGASLATGPAAPGNITINQMYVSYRIPAGKKKGPIVMGYGSHPTRGKQETTHAGG